jgi:hypothetical protein
MIIKSLRGLITPSFLSFCDFCLLLEILGGGGRVRTRNTLHIVGARKSSICYDAVERRKKKKRKRDKIIIL